jgi:hypothetical protein
MNEPLAKQITFGLKNMIPEDATVAWGARWIIQENWQYKRWIEAEYYGRKRKGRRPKQFVVDFVFDRQGFAGSDEEIEAFKKELNKGGKTRSAVVKAHKEAERLFNNFEWEFRCSSPRSAGPKVLFRDDRLEIVGDPRSSGGYIYVIAYRRAQPAAEATG